MAQKLPDSIKTQTEDLIDTISLFQDQFGLNDNIDINWGIVDIKAATEKIHKIITEAYEEAQE